MYDAKFNNEAEEPEGLKNLLEGGETVVCGRS